MTNWNEEARRLLPCTKDCDEWRGDTVWNQTNPHHPSCLAFRRIAVAAALAAAEALGAEQSEFWKINAVGNAEEISRLKAERDDFRESNTMWFKESKKAYAQKHEALAERDAAKAEVARLKECLICEGGSCGHFIEAEQLRAIISSQESIVVEANTEVNQLRAERDAAVSQLEQSPAVQGAMKRFHLRLEQRDELVVQGLEIAMGLCFDSRTPNIANAIQAEIDKRKGAHGETL